MCLPDDDKKKEEEEGTKSYSMMPPAFNRSMDDMFLLTDMPLDLFPNVALSPSQVNNVSEKHFFINQNLSRAHESLIL